MSRKCCCCDTKISYLYWDESHEDFFCASCLHEVENPTQYYKGFDAAHDESLEEGFDIKQAIESFSNDEPDTAYQWGYINALLILSNEGGKNV